MPNDPLALLKGLDDDELLARVKALLARERGDVAEVVAHLAELDTRDVHFRAGYASLFAYCRDALGLSEAEAYNRIEVARAVRRFPAVLDGLADGSLHLTSVRLLAPHLTLENHRAVLESARGRRKAEVEEIVARLAPRTDVASSVRRLPALSAADLGGPHLPDRGRADGAGPEVGPASPAGPLLDRPRAEALERPPGRVSALTKPLAPDRYRLQLTISHQTLQKLRLARDMLRHAIPSGDDAAILDRALTALLEELARRKFAATDNPRPARATAPSSRHVPAEVKRAVWLRDVGRCAFVGTNGRRCTELGFLEFHHRKPYAVGGGATVSNIELRCRRHNDYEARVFFRRDELPLPGEAAGGRPPASRLVPERVGGAASARSSAFGEGKRIPDRRPREGAPLGESP
jgi:hypothetical protein